MVPTDSTRNKNSKTISTIISAFRVQQHKTARFHDIIWNVNLHESERAAKKVTARAHPKTSASSTRNAFFRQLNYADASEYLSISINSAYGRQIEINLWKVEDALASLSASPARVASLESHVPAWPRASDKLTFSALCVLVHSLFSSKENLLRIAHTPPSRPWQMSGLRDKVRINNFW